MGEKLGNQVEVRRASLAEKKILAHLLQLHSHDMSEFNDAEIDRGGLFGYEGFDEFWTQQERFPYLMWMVGRPVGFALMVQEEREDEHTPFMFVADFFILKKYRRQGIGQAAACELFDFFPGESMVSELTRNVNAQAFWRQVIGDYSAGKYVEEPLEDGVIQIFDSLGRR